MITRAQALRAGLSPRAIGRRLGAGQWLMVHPRVYLIAGSPTTWHQQVLAACLWGGDTSAASHRCAAALWGLPGAPRIIEISTTRACIRAGITVHQTLRAVAPESQRIEGIPVTDAARTLIDLGSSLPRDEVEVLLDHVLHRRITSLSQLNKRLDVLEGPGWRGTKHLRRLLAERNPDLAPAASRFETKLYQVLRRNRFELPERQVNILDEAGFIGRVDFAYPARRLILEAQSYEYHGDRTAWLSDVGRRQRLALAHWQVVEVTWHDVTKNEAQFVARFRSFMNAQELSFHERGRKKS